MSPEGYAGIRFSQLSGVRPGTLYPGTHLIEPTGWSRSVVRTLFATGSFSTTALAVRNDKMELLEVHRRARASPSALDSHRALPH